MHRAVFALVFLTALGVSAAFPVFDLRPLRQKLASPVLSRRRLLQSGLCAWDAEASVCQGSGAAGIPILTASDSSIAQFLATQFQCLTATDRDACDDVGFCFWDRSVEECVYLEFSVTNPESPCVQNAPATLRLFSTVRICPAETLEEECEGVEGCEWDLETLTCDSDTLTIFLGISGTELRMASQTLVANQTTVGLLAFSAEYDVADPGFDWSVALGYDFPSIDCPDDTDATICAYADVLTSLYLPTFTYCRGTYDSPEMQTQCAADPLCAIDLDRGTCTAPDTVATEAATRAIEVLVASISNPTDSNLLAAGVSCGQADDEASCTAAHDLCLWNPVELSCGLSTSGLFQSLADAGDDLSDGVCDFFAFLGGTGCEDIFDEATCLANDLCEYDLEGCGTSGDSIVAALVADDPDLEEEIEAIDDACSEFSTQAECEA